MNETETSPMVQRAMQKFYTRVAELGAKKKLASDDDLAERVRRLVDERDHLLRVATEMLATILLQSNQSFVSAELRVMAGIIWRPQIEAIASGRELTSDELKAALSISGIDMQKAHERLRALIDKVKTAKAK